MNLKAFAGFAAWGLIAASVSLIFVFAFSTFFGSAESLVINGVNVSTSAPNGATAVYGNSNGIVVKNGTAVLYNFTVNITSGMNISIINITFPAWPFDASSANISLVNSSSVPANVQVSAPTFTGWAVRFVQNYSNGGIKTVELNGTFAPETINGTNGSVMFWFAFNGTANITGLGNLSDNQTMTWEIGVANATEMKTIKTTTIVDNNPPRILATIPSVNASGNTYIGGLAAEKFQVNVSDMGLNVSTSTLNDGSTNVTLWYKESTAQDWNAKTLLCYNETGGLGVNYPNSANSMYTCNITVDLTGGGSPAVPLSEGNILQYFFNASDLVLNMGFNGTQSVPRQAQVDRTAPTSSSVSTNITYVNSGKVASLNAVFSDNFQLVNATLATNETNSGAAVFFNYTDNATLARGPITMTGSSYIVNFTWTNSSVASNTIVAWQIIAMDAASNAHATQLKTFVVDNDAPSTHGGFISPINEANISNMFTVNVSVNDSLAGVSMVYLNISYEAASGSIAGINNITLTQAISGYFSASINSTLNLPGVVADGNYTFRIVANDSLNNVNNSQTIRVWIDNNPPSILNNTPVFGTIVTGSFVINATVNDAVRVSNVQYQISNSTFAGGYFNMFAFNPLLMNNSGSYNSTNQTNAYIFQDGTYNVTIRANDSANNFTYVNVTITIDNVQNATVLDANSTVGSAYINGTVAKSGASISLNLNTLGNQYGYFPDGYGYNVSVYMVNSSGTAIYAGNISNVSQFWANGSITIPTNSATNVIDDGNRSFLFKTFDNRGNLMVNGSSNFTVSIDNTAANYSNAIPSNNSFNSGSVTQLFQISLTEVNLNLSKNVTLYWNYSSSSVDIQSKTLLCTGSGSGLYNGVGPNWVCNTTLSLSGLAEGKNIYYFFNNSNVTQPNGDLAGNGASFGTQAIPLNTTVNRNAPSVGVLLPLGSANVTTSFLLNISANNSASGVSSVSYRITNDTFQSDSVSLTRGAGTTYNGYWNGTNTTQPPGLVDGHYRVNINATSAAGVSNTTINVTITIDNTKPNVTITLPAVNATWGAIQNYSTSFVINATVRDSGLDSVVSAGDVQSIQYFLSNSSWTGSLIALTNNSESGLAFDYYNATNTTSANLADGTYKLTINATDYAGNSNVTQITFINIDGNAPMVSIKTPANGQYITGSFNIAADVNDGTWVNSVWYRMSNGTHALDVRGSSYLAMTNASGTNLTNGGYFNATNVTDAINFGDGSYNITVGANDTLNHVAYSNVTITIDNNAPSTAGDTLGNTSEPAGNIQYFPGRFYRFNKTFNDTVGVANVTLQINLTIGTVNRSAFLYEGSSALGNWSANITDLSANATHGYGLTWYVTDATGNVLITPTWYYAVAKNISPSVILEVNGTQISGGNVNTLTWERGTALNVTSYSPLDAKINTTLYANMTQYDVLATSFVPYPAGNQNITISSSSTVLGPYNISANTTSDSANYTGNATLATFIVTLQDSFPRIILVAPLNMTNVSGTLLINASAIDASGVSNVTYVLINTTDQIVQSGMMNNTNNVANHYNVSIPTTSLPDGRYELNITSSDINGNNNQTYYFNITIDNTAPTVIFNYQTSVREVWSTPGNNSYRSGTINVNVTIADALADVFTNNQLVRIGNRTHWMGPALIMSTVTGDLAGYYNRTNGTTVLADGFYNITITANDTAGNVVTNTTYFNVDNTAPSAVIALSNSTRGTYRANSSEQIRIQINDAVQTNATIDVYTRWPNGSVIFKSATAVPGTATVYNFTIDTSDLVTDQMVKYYIAATDNASNAATLTGTLSSPLSNITIDVNCGNVGNPLSWCSGSSLKATANGWASTSLPPKASVESISSLQSNFTISNVTKRSGIWGQFNYTYYYDGSSWLAFDPNSPPSTNTLKTFNNTGAQLYWFNVNASNVVFRIQ